MTHELLTGWGRTAPTAAAVVRPRSPGELVAAAAPTGRRGLVARGLARSYGDAAQNAGGTVVDTTATSGIVDLDLASGEATVLAGTSLHDLLRWLVPLGWFPPLTPGTRYVTVGGAIAADIHGKDHHVAGTFGQHVRSLRLALPDGRLLQLSREDGAEELWATTGGMGLTGVIVDATLSLLPIESSRLVVDTDRAPDLDAAMALMEGGDHRYRYSVAWIDLLARGRHLGRSVLTRGRFARREELPRRLAADPLAYRAGTLLTAPALVPPGLLNRATIRAFNEAWYRGAPAARRGELQAISTFFHPLDGVAAWNRVYGPRGFVQWQYVVPPHRHDVVRRTVEALSSASVASFLAVLKRFGPPAPGHLSFPVEGWTLALDIPAGVPGLGPLLDQLDEEVAAAGGRVYLAKDARLRPELVPVMYPRLDEWRAVRQRLDPTGQLRSDLARRLHLC